MDVTLTTIIPTNPTTPSTTTTTSTENNIIRIRIKKKTPLKQSKPKTPIPIQSRHFLMTSRFSTETYEQNMLIKKAYNIQCIYGTPTEISKLIPKRNILFILEMNNTKNRIEGIGLIVNKVIISDPRYCIYKNGNYNRYTYKGRYRLSRDMIERYNSGLLEVFDYILFKEKTHLKRGSGFTKIPKKLYEKEICQSFNSTFENPLLEVKLEMEMEMDTAEEKIKKEIIRLFKTYCRRHI